MQSEWEENRCVTSQSPSSPCCVQVHWQAAPRRRLPPSSTANLSATEGTVTFSGAAVAVGIGFQWGGGTLTYQGQQYSFKASGLSVVDVGVSRATGVGTVRNLRNVADFSGNYVSASAGATVAGGGSATTLRNQNGVVIDGLATTQGARFTLAPGGVSITLTGP